LRTTKTIFIAVPILAAISLLLTFSNTQSRVPQTRQTAAARPEQQLTLERTVSAQRRFNRFFEKDVTPKLKDCWARIKGKGTVEIKYTYRRDANGKLASDQLAVSSSTLPPGQEAVALRCMEDSLRGTNFPSDSNQSTYTLYWNWSVPLPANFPQAATQISAGAGVGGGGCDGKGAPARCWMCAVGGCRPACFGGESCRIIRPYCRVVGDCGTGGIYGVAAGDAAMQ
jgi:hypothetical protein